MEKLQQNLHLQSDRLETEMGQIAEAILEVQGWIGIPDEVMSWTPIGGDCEEELLLESGLPDVDAEAASMSV